QMERGPQVVKSSSPYAARRADGILSHSSGQPHEGLRACDNPRRKRGGHLLSSLSWSVFLAEPIAETRPEVTVRSRRFRIDFLQGLDGLFAYRFAWVLEQFDEIRDRFSGFWTDAPQGRGRLPAYVLIIIFECLDQCGHCGHGFPPDFPQG